MHVLVHDYAGHAFPIQLSRALAREGHQVTHVFSAGFQSPKGPLQARETDSPALEIIGIQLNHPFRKHTIFTRALQEREYGRKLSAVILKCRPDIVLSGNSPLSVQAFGQRAARRLGARFVFWVQDIYSAAVGTLLRPRIGQVARVIGASLRRQERRLLSNSHRIVTISEDFRQTLGHWSIPLEKCRVIENWAVLEDIPVVSRENAWARLQKLPTGPRIVYSGTLGMKHRPEMLADLARAALKIDAHVVVVSEGLGATWLSSATSDLPNLRVLPFQPHATLPDVLGSADVLVALLDPQAGSFSVPSKILAYLCAGRPVVGALPSQNLASEIIRLAEAGTVCDPQNSNELIEATIALLLNPTKREQLGRNGRKFAEQTFAIERVVEKFTAVFNEALNLH